jgi:hypothetical protein
MLRPPSADRILSGDYHALYEFDADLKHRTELAADALAHFEPYGVRDPAYSPDGSMIAFELARVAGVQWGETIGTYLIKADGTDLRKLSSGPGWIASWSPDGVAVALERWTTEPDRKDVIVVVNTATGAERVLDATAVDHKGPSEPDFQGWSWSPDGRGIVFLESPGDHPYVVDVATGDVTELPWTADSVPSWQRVP